MATIQIECKNLKVGMRDPRGATWCPKCIHYSLTDNHGVCECCKFKIGRNSKNFPNLAVFELIASVNMEIIEQFVNSKVPADLECCWPVSIGMYKFLVPIHYFAEYMNLNDINDMRRFEKTVRENCQILPKWIKAVK